MGKIGRVSAARYRIYEPETPAELPAELMQDWSSEGLMPQVGMVIEWTDGESWRLVAIEDDPEPGYTGRLHFTRD